MKKCASGFLLFLLFCASIQAQKAARSKDWRPKLIPIPVSVTVGSGYLELPYDLFIITPNNKEIKQIANRLAFTIGNMANDVKVKTDIVASPKSIFLLLSNDKTIPKEGYRLKVTNQNITITANESTGIFYGIQTLLQLLPAEVEEKRERKSPL